MSTNQKTLPFARLESEHDQETGSSQEEVKGPGRPNGRGAAQDGASTENRSGTGVRSATRGNSSRRGSGGRSHSAYDIGEVDERLREAIEEALTRQPNRFSVATAGKGQSGTEPDEVTLTILGVDVTANRRDDIPKIALRYWVQKEWAAISRARRSVYGPAADGETGGDGYDHPYAGVCRCNGCQRRRDHVRVSVPAAEESDLEFGNAYHITCTVCGEVCRWAFIDAEDEKRERRPAGEEEGGAKDMIRGVTG